MIEKVILLSFLILATSYVTFADYSPDTQTITNDENRFNITNADGKKALYQIKTVAMDYTPDQLTVRRNKESNSADITLKKGFMWLIYGDLVEFLGREQYSDHTFIKTQYINVNANGTAALAADGRHVEHCKFEWEQTKPIYKNELKDAVRDGLIEHLEELLGEKLCVSVNKTITKFSV